MYSERALAVLLLTGGFLLFLFSTSLQLIMILLLLEAVMLCLVFYRVVAQPWVIRLTLVLLTIAALEAALALSLAARLMRSYGETHLQRICSPRHKDCSSFLARAYVGPIIGSTYKFSFDHPIPHFIKVVGRAILYRHYKVVYGFADTMDYHA